MTMPRAELKNTTFVLQGEEKENSEETYLFFKRVKLDMKRVLLQIVNITDSVTKQNIKMENESLTVLNACISHEFRNPLNSISA